jgi:hypothetical protein
MASDPKFGILRIAGYFNYDLLNSASAPPGGADLPAIDMLPTQDASLWQVYIECNISRCSSLAHAAADDIIVLTPVLVRLLFVIRAST